MTLTRNLTAETTPIAAHLAHLLKDPSGAPADRKVTLAVLAASAPWSTLYATLAATAPATLAADPAFTGRYLSILAPSGDATGATDVTNLNTATAAATAAGGGAVVLGGGIFYFNARPDVPSNVTIRGMGWATILRATAANATGLLRMRGAANVTIRDLAVDGNGYAGILINTELPVTTTVAVGHTVQRVHFTGSTNTCCRVVNPVDDYAFVDNTIDGVDDGLNFDVTTGTTSTGIRVERNNVRNITGTTLPSYGHGIQLYGVTQLYQDVRVCDNIVMAGVDSIPIEVTGCTGVTVSGNVVDGGGRGISTGRNFDIAVTWNVIRNQTIYAVESGDNERVVIANNVAYNCACLVKETGATAGVDMSITDNLYVGSGLGAAAGGYVIYIGAGGGAARIVKIEGNTIRGADYLGGIRVGGAAASDNVTIRNNDIYVDTANALLESIRVARGTDITVEDNKIIVSRDLVAGDDNKQAICINMGGVVIGAAIDRNEVLFTGAIGASTTATGIGTAPGSPAALARSRMVGNRVHNAPYGFGASTTSADFIFTDNDGRTCVVEHSINAAVIYRRTRRDYEGTAAPTAGTWVAGDRVWNTAPAGGGVPGWICTTGGTSGTWKDMAVLAA